MSKPACGFIGLGLMGSAMVECLQGNGYAVSVLGNRNRAGLDAAVARGASEAASARELAANSDIVMLCVSTSEQVEARMRGEDGVIAGLNPGAIVLDFGTSLPGSTRQLASEVAAAGGSYLDAPLGRTPAHAKDGLLNIMCAGDKTAYEKVKPVLDVLGENVFHLGESGAGHTIKLLNNAFAMTTATTMSEIFAMADASGVSRQSVYDVMSAGPVHSGMMDFIAAYALENVPDKLAFSIANASKDLGYYIEMAKGAGVTPRVPSATSSTLNELVEQGHGELLVPQLLDALGKQQT